LGSLSSKLNAAIKAIQYGERCDHRRLIRLGLSQPTAARKMRI
jgi:hypothetical protein